MYQARILDKTTQVQNMSLLHTSNEGTHNKYYKTKESNMFDSSHNLSIYIINITRQKSKKINWYNKLGSIRKIINTFELIFFFKIMLLTTVNK